jgi:hypothetical protein
LSSNLDAHHASQYPTQSSAFDSQYVTSADNQLVIFPRDAHVEKGKQYFGIQAHAGLDSTLGLINLHHGNGGHRLGGDELS